ncbi:MAG: amidohydrolase family protein [Chloroflexi bacterium]|nr:amidohydrolase family protein [Chloroflexota bacterium]
MLVDAHVHCFVWEEFPPGEKWAYAGNWAWYSPGLWTRVRPFIPPIDKKGPWRDPADVYARVSKAVGDPDGAKLMAYLDAHGIEKCVCMMVDWGIAWGEEAEFNVHKVNERGGQLKKRYAGRFSFQAAVDPRRRDAPEIAEKAIKEYGASGIKILAANNVYPDDPSCFPLYEIARDYGKTVTVHTGSGDVAAFIRPAHPWHLETPAKLFPKLQFVAAHGGGGLDGYWRDLVLMCSTIPNIAMDLSEWQHDVVPSDVDPGREEEFIKVLNILRKKIGAHSLMIGTDYMVENVADAAWWWDLWKDLPARARKFGYKFTQEETNLIVGDNARRIYGTG